MTSDLSDIDWTLNPPYAPWFGGAFESMVKLTKNTLKHTVQYPKYLLTDDELNTALHQVTALVNNRPLVKPSTDPNDPPAVRPNDFLHGGKSVASIYPYQPGEEVDLRLIKRDVDRLVQEVWQTMQKGLIAKLNKMYEKSSKKPNTVFEVGDLVLVGEETVPTEHWKTGIIEKLETGKNGIVRVAEIRTGQKVERRSVKCIGKIPCAPTPLSCRFL